MKIEPRGKFGGIKVHLDAIEVNGILAQATRLCKEFVPFDLIHEKAAVKSLKEFKPGAVLHQSTLMIALAAQIKKLMIEHPDLLEDKPSEVITATLKKEIEHATAKLALVNEGVTWSPTKGLAKEIKKLQKAGAITTAKDLEAAKKSASLGSLSTGHSKHS